MLMLGIATRITIESLLQDYRLWVTPLSVNTHSTVLKQPCNKRWQQALADAAGLQAHVDLTWMAVPGVMKRLHVVQLDHGSFY